LTAIWLRTIVTYFFIILAVSGRTPTFIHILSRVHAPVIVRQQVDAVYFSIIKEVYAIIITMIIVYDSSSDDSAEIARRLRVIVVKHGLVIMHLVIKHSNK
jgi:hypothetical protein